MTKKLSARGTSENTWMAQEAKARFSEVMRRAREVGPQHVTVHGRDEAVVLSAEEYRNLRGERRTGADLIAAMQAFPGGDEVDLEPERFPMPVREVDFP